MELRFIGSEVKLTDGDKGYVNYHRDINRTAFNEGRDYLYPIPSDQLALYKDRGYVLEQNPGWN